jgi:hypothetical protein
VRVVKAKKAQVVPLTLRDRLGVKQFDQLGNLLLG